MRCFSIILLAACSLTGQGRADEKTDADEVKTVVETYLKNQASPTRCDDNLAFCVGDGVHLVVHKEDDKLNSTRTVKQINEYIKGALKEDQALKIESVKVDVKEGTGLAVAFASFKADETSCYSVFTLSKRGDKWKVVSITQENRR